MTSGRSLSGEDYRELFGAVPAAVAVVTTLTDSGPHGTTVSAFGPLSLDPPLVQVCLDRESSLLGKVRDSGYFAINVLASEQEEVALRFSRKGDDDFAGIEWQKTRGSAWLVDSHGRLAAACEQIVEAGDHSIVIGLALEAEVSLGVPLLYHQRSFRIPSPIDTGAA